MKKFLVVFLVLSLLFSIALVTAETPMSAELLSYDPVPAQPGQYIDVYIELTNVGDSDASNALIEVVNDFPFTVVGDSLVSVGSLQSQRSYVSDFRIKVDSQAVVGNNRLTVKFSSDGVSWQERSFNVEVKSNDVSLYVASVSTSPDELIPGGEGIVTVRLKNSESIVLRNIGVKLGLVSISQNAVSDLPFIPTGSATEKKISRLNPDEFSEISFPIKVYPSASPGYYKLPLTLIFYDDQGTKTETQDLIGLVVKSVPDLMIYTEETTISQKNTVGDVTLKFVNKGINDLKFLDISLEQSDDYDVISIPREYIGDLDSDDYRSETFTINPFSESVDLKVSVSFKDENNNDYSEIISVPFKLSEASSDNNYFPSISTILLILVFVIIIVRWFVKRNKSKKQK